MTGQHMAMEDEPLLLGAAPRVLHHPVKAASRDRGRLPDLLDELGQRRDLLDAHHVQLGLVLPSQTECERQSLVA
jgi:hypothetical protein